MKIKMDTPLLDSGGIEQLKSEDGKIVTLRVVMNVLLLPVKTDTDIEKYQKWEIFKKIRESKDFVDLKVEDLAVIKKTIGLFSPPLILGQCYEIMGL